MKHIKHINELNKSGKPRKVRKPSNAMMKTNDDQWKGESVSDIKRYAREDGDKYGHATKRREIFLWNKLSKALKIHNPDFIMNFYDNNKYGDNWEDFVDRLFKQVQDGRIKLEDIGEIEERDNGTRGTARTMHMILWNKDKSAILDAADVYQNRYYYL